MTHLDSMLKIRAITLPAMVHTVEAMVFPVVIYRRESWTKKKKKRLRTKELVQLNCGAGEYSCKSLGQQGGQTSQP